MLDLIISEFQKLRRKRFIQITLLASVLFPIPLTIFMARDGESFGMLFRSVVAFGDLLFLPCILGIIASMLFFMERDNDTLKNLLVIPLPRSQILFAKLFVLLAMSVLYSVASLGATLIGGIFTGRVEGVLARLLVSAALGVFVMLAAMPVIAVILAGNKSYIFSILLSFFYAIIGFLVAWSYPAQPGAGMLGTLASVLPIPLIFRWYIGALPVEPALDYLLPYTVSTPALAAILAVVGCAFGALAVFFYKRADA